MNFIDETYGMCKCPECKRKFVASPVWAYRDEDNRRLCSYKCLRAHQRRKENSAHERKIAERIRKELGGC